MAIKKTMAAAAGALALTLAGGGTVLAAGQNGHDGIRGERVIGPGDTTGSARGGTGGNSGQTGNSGKGGQGGNGAPGGDTVTRGDGSLRSGNGALHNGKRQSLLHAHPNKPDPQPHHGFDSPFPF